MRSSRRRNAVKIEREAMASEPARASQEEENGVQKLTHAELVQGEKETTYDAETWRASQIAGATAGRRSRGKSFDQGEEHEMEARSATANWSRAGN